MLAAQAAKNAGKNDRTAINDALGTIGTYQGISGAITFDENGDVRQAAQHRHRAETARWPPLPSSRRRNDPHCRRGEGGGAAPLAPPRHRVTESTPRDQRTS